MYTEAQSPSKWSVQETDRRVAILLATYNGEKYLDEQIGSLFSQTYRDFVIIARDDGSSDGTAEILARWSAAYPDQIRVVSDDHGNLSSLGNFSRLLELCDAPYFAFCDQDDVWLPNKVELAINEVRRLENRCGKATPILVHSDLIVVDECLNEICASFYDYLQFDSRRSRRLDHLLFENMVTGCASMGNRALLELARPIPGVVPYHDWWLALVAKSCGVLKTIAEPTILYRQHSHNFVGAGRPRRRRSTLWYGRRVLQQPRLLRWHMPSAILTVQSRGDVLLRIAGDRMPRRNREFLRAFCLPRRRDEVARLPWAQRTWLFARFLMASARVVPLALPWCY
jgi:glycosyltransferase involved in cell wall biosynthesis